MRLERIANGVSEFLVEQTPELVLIEGPSYDSRNSGSAHDRSGLWWFIVRACGDAGCGVPAIVTPQQRIKYALGKAGGKGVAKDDVLAATVRRYPNVPIANNDEADALLLAAVGARHLGFPIEDSLPQANLAAMAKIAWPEAVR